jgi:hypothetical protein
MPPNERQYQLNLANAPAIVKNSPVLKEEISTPVYRQGNESNKFEFKKFDSYNPTPGDLMKEIYRYMRFTNNGNINGNKQKLFAEGLKKVTSHYHYSFGLNDTTAQIFIQNAHENWSKKRDNFNWEEVN